MNILTAIYNQLFPRHPKDTKIVITKNAREGMGRWGVTEEQLKYVVLKGTEVRANMIVKQYRNFSIGTITTYDKTTKTFLVLAVWKREW